MKQLRKYNELIADETIEDYSLRYAPKSFRKFSEILIANTAIGSISFLALEAIGAGIGIEYGFATAFWAILTASFIIFFTAIPISYYAAKYNIDIDLITRSAGFGYVGSTFTSLIYASFSFIFFALEASIMAQAIEAYFGLPLGYGYLLSSLIIIPLVFYGITFITKLQLYTQPIWLAMMIIPFIAIIIKEPNALNALVSLQGQTSHTNQFNGYYFGFAVGISLSLIAQIGEQVDYLRFMPSCTKQNRFRWWTSLLLAGPGWIIIGFLKQIGGMFLASILLLFGYSLTQAKTPIEMYTLGYSYVFDNPQTALIAATLFVIISQIKINVTNAYAGSLAWSNFFSRITHSHPGRVVWMIFNIGIALLLMELGVFDALEKVLGLYSNIAIAWIGAIFADLIINKPLGLSPKITEFKRAYLYNINPVGVGSMLIASIISILAFMGLFGAYAQSYSSLLAMGIAIILSPFIAYITKGRYYIARKNLLITQSETHYICKTCNHTYEKEDMAFCPFHDAYICSLCCSLDALCHDNCKVEYEQGLKKKVGKIIQKLFFHKISLNLSLKIFDFLTLVFFFTFVVSVLAWMILSLGLQEVPIEQQVYFRTAIYHYSIIIMIFLSVIAWWILLIQDSRQRAEILLEEQNKELKNEVKFRKIAEKKAENETKAKAEFLANMSHELRTPMNSIIGMSHLISQTQLDTKQKDYMIKITTSAISLLNLINNILDFSKMEAKKLQLENHVFDMKELLQNIIDIITIPLEEKGLQLHIDYDNTLARNFSGDSLRLSQILTNLLSNAIKFTDKGDIYVKIEKVGHHRFKFQVKDNGIGLNAQEQKSLFEAFNQANDTITRQYGGTGLGLSIVKELVQLMHGKIWIQSQKNKGSIFYFEITLHDIADGIYLNDLTSTTETKKIKKEVERIEKVSTKNAIINIEKKELGTRTKELLKNELLMALHTNKPKECNYVIQKIQQYQFKDTQKFFARVLIYIKKYKFKEAVEILNKW